LRRVFEGVVAKCIAAGLVATHSAGCALKEILCASVRTERLAWANHG
jgi:hypothetical protein